MALSAQTKDKIETLIRDNPVVLFMKGNKSFPQCGFSASVVKTLQQLKTDFHAVNVLTDPEIREGIKEFSNWPTIPQLYVKGQFVGGSDIVNDLFSSGELQSLLGLEPPAPVSVPTLSITKLAADALKQALADSENEVLRFVIDEQYQYDLFIGPAEPNDVIVSCEGVKVHLKRDSASRAEGTTIDFVSGDTGGFKITNPNEPARVKSLSVTDCKAMMDRNEAFTLVDVRSRSEWDIAKINGAKLLDDDLAKEIDKMDRSSPLVFQCHHGVRSRAAAERYILKGYKNVYNLEGGIDAWSVEVDPTVRRY